MTGTEFEKTERCYRPTSQAIDAAFNIIKYVINAGVESCQMDFDVLGGIAIFFKNTNNQDVWVACMNSGNNTITISEHEKVIRHTFINMSEIKSSCFIC